MASDRPVYVISVAAELAGVHPQTLRIYERRGLIRPKRTAGGSRRYSEEDIERLRRIQQLTAEGVSLAGVERFIEMENEIIHLHRRLEDLEARHRAELRDVHRQYRREIVPVRQQIEVFRRR